MYVTLHTITIVENDWVIQAQFLQTTNVNNLQLIARRVILRAYPVKNTKRNLLVKPNLKTIFKRKNHVRHHHVRAIKMYDIILIILLSFINLFVVYRISPNRQNDFIPKLDDCGNGIGDAGSPVLPRCSSNSNILLQDNQIDEIGNVSIIFYKKKTKN